MVEFFYKPSHLAKYVACTGVGVRPAMACLGSTEEQGLVQEDMATLAIPFSASEKPVLLSLHKSYSFNIVWKHSAIKHLEKVLVLAKEKL